MVEGTPLLREHTGQNLYPGFESLRLRQFKQSLSIQRWRPNVGRASETNALAPPFATPTGTGSKNGVNTFALLRYHGNGAIDANFGVGGVMDIPVGSINDYAKAVAIQSDGGIIAAGYTEDSTGFHGALVRVNGGSAVGLPYLVEYYHWLFGHYFISLDPWEIHDLDTGVHANWFRTGEGFKAYTVPTGAVNPVCRFYIPPAKGDSHFFSASAQECADTHTKFPDLIYESPNVFFIGLPDTITGACPLGAIPVYRVWNARPDSNHRYTTSRVTRDDMVQEGYIAEGYGSDQVAMCAPQ